MKTGDAAVAEKVIVIRSSELAVSRNPAVIKTIGLGSCVGVTLYEERRKVGGMAHIMLPKNRKEKHLSVRDAAKFADAAIDLLIRRMLRMHAGKGMIKAKVFGGANMFPHIIKSEEVSIGYQNVTATMEALAGHGIPVVAGETGGDFGRTLVFDLKDGLVTVRTSKGEQRFY